MTSRPSTPESPARLTPADEVRRRVAAARPLAGGPLPPDLHRRLGATHYDGKYHLTRDPFLVEGARALHELGLGCAKFWLDKSLGGYRFNSPDWPDLSAMPYAQIAAHPYFREALELPFSTVIFEVGPISAQGVFEPDFDFPAHEDDVYGLARYLLETYRDRDIAFILQNWEGDWVFRGTPIGKLWTPGGPPDLDRRTDAMVRWFSARQRGVERARRDVPGTRATVRHAIEVNRVIDGASGIPTLATHVLPRVPVDLVSWSCYDGLADAVTLWHGVETLRAAGRPVDGTGPVPVFVGEIGFPENGVPRNTVRDWWDERLAVLLALEVPYIVHWELYCNEPLDGVGRHEAVVRGINDMRGYWLIRPDGSRSHAGELFVELLARDARPAR